MGFVAISNKFVISCAMMHTTVVTYLAFMDLLILIKTFYKNFSQLELLTEIMKTFRECEPFKCNVSVSFTAVSVTSSSLSLC